MTDLTPEKLSRTAEHLKGQYEGRGYTFGASRALTGDSDDKHQIIARHPDHDNGDWTGHRVGVLQWDGKTGDVDWASTHPDHPRVPAGMISEAINYSQFHGVHPPTQAPVTTPAGHRLLKHFNPEAAAKSEMIPEREHSLSDGWT